MRAILDRTASRADRVWLVSYPHVRATARGEVQDALASWGAPARRLGFAGGDIVLYHRRS
jgi:hypothetical protein